MSWLKHVAVPRVPNDEKDRREAIAQSTKALESAIANQAVVDRAVAIATGHARRNHFALRLQQAYGKDES